MSYAFYRGADCCALVYDITNKESFEKLSHWRKSFIENTGIADAESFPFVLMGNKADLENDRSVTKEQVQDWCSKNNDMKHYETSAKDDMQVNEAFMDVIKQALEKIKSDDILWMPSSIGGGIGGNADGGTI